jgi:nucleoside-diphosphate-sugar epimerase
MQVKIIKTFHSKSRRRIFRRGEVVDGEPIWCNSLVASGLASIVEEDRPEHTIKGKRRRLKIAGNKLEASEESGDKVFLTGHKGYLGGYISKELQPAYDIEGFDLLDGQDILNYEQLKSAMAGSQYVVHGAGIPHPNPKYSFMDYFNTNVIGTLNVLRAAAENRIYRFIYLCSGAIYGWDTHGKMIPLYFPIDESHPMPTTSMQFKGALDGYSQSKLIAEQLLAYYGTNGFFQAVSLRIGPAVPQEKFFDKKRLENPNHIPDRIKTFWVNTEPETVARGVKCALEAKKLKDFDIFNLVEKTVPDGVDLLQYLQKHYPKVPIKKGWHPPASLLSTAKVEKALGI